MNDLIERLRYGSLCPVSGDGDQDKLEAADRIERLEDALDTIDAKALGGLCYFTLESARCFLKEIRDVVAEAQGKEGA